jgi:hypothetical protein
MGARVGVVTLVIASLASSAARGSPHQAEDQITGDRITVGYFASRPIAGHASGIANAIAARWDRMLDSGFEFGLGLELGYSGGDEPLTRATLLPGVAWRAKLAQVLVGADVAAGPQIVRGRVTIDGIPLSGIEPRGFHAELAAAIDGELTSRLYVRARAGVAIDGLYPAGHASTRGAPFVEIAIVIRR